MIRDVLNYREEIFVKRALRVLRIFREICRKSGESREYRECFIVNEWKSGSASRL